MESMTVLLFLVLIVPLVGAIMAATPYLTPKHECFAVTVPESAQRDPQIVALKRHFVRKCLVLTVVLTLAVGAVAAWAWDEGFSAGASMAFAWSVVFAALVLMAVPFAFMLQARRGVTALKRERGWFAPRAQAAALVAEDDMPHGISLTWNLLYIPVFLAVAAVGVVGYPHMPDFIPMHADFAGNVTGYSSKSPAVVGFPLIMIAFFGAAFTLCHVVMNRSKRPVDPGAPVTSALAYGLFVRAQSIFLLMTGLALSLGTGFSFMLSALDVIDLSEAAAIVLVMCVPVLVGAVALSVIYGQSGSRLFRRMEAAGTSGAEALLMPLDDDAHWKLGVIYWNPDDASLWLPQRFGVGWTMNLARPAAWLLVAGFAVVTAVFCVGCVLLVG